MNANDLNINDMSRWIDNLIYSRKLKQNFDAYLVASPVDGFGRFWDIPVSVDDLWVQAYSSPENTPVAGVVRYVNLFNQDSEPLIGRALENVPEVLRKRSQWIWLTTSENERPIRQIPYLCRGVSEDEGLLPKNWMSFSDLSSESTNEHFVNGYVLDNDEVDNSLRLVVIEMSSQRFSLEQAKNLCRALGNPYFEYSKNCHGWTILGLVNQQLPTINCDGVKIFTGGDFVELSGLGAEGKLIDITKEVLAFHTYRFPSSTHKNTIFNPRPNTPREIARLKDMLISINADCSYDTYMRVVWGILSTGWPEAEQIALDWSLSDGDFSQKTFDNLVRSFDPNRSSSTTMGTIYHLARQGGWRG